GAEAEGGVAGRLHRLELPRTVRTRGPFRVLRAVGVFVVAGVLVTAGAVAAGALGAHPAGRRVGGALGRRRQAGALLVREGRGEGGGGGPQRAGLALRQRVLYDGRLPVVEVQPRLHAGEVALGQRLAGGPVGLLRVSHGKGEGDEGREGQAPQRGSRVHGDSVGFRRMGWGSLGRGLRGDIRPESGRGSSRRHQRYGHVTNGTWTGASAPPGGCARASFQ